MPSRSLTIGGKPVTLDARPDRLDLRDREYLPPLRSLPPRYPDAPTLSKYLVSYVKSGLVLDQGKEGACTGYGLAAVVNYLLWTRALEAKVTKGFRAISPHMLYDLAQFYDEWPGEDYEGSSCRGAMKGWHKHGVCEEALWKHSVRAAPQKAKKSDKAYKPDDSWAKDAATRPVGVYYRVNHKSVVDMQAAIVNMGAIYVSANVHDGWGVASRAKKTVTHDTLPVVKFGAGTRANGGHAFALVGYNEQGFVVQNSWGTAWGLSGFAVMTYADWVANGCDAWVCSLGVPQSAAFMNNVAIEGATARQHRRSSLLAGDRPPANVSLDTTVTPWPTQRAYEHTVVAGNNGQVRMCKPDIGTAEGLVEHVVKTNVGAWLENTAPKKRKIVIYAHGGLNKEEESIDRIRILAPYFFENGVYPLFYTWRTGVWETITSKLEDLGDKAPPEQLATGFFSDAKDHLIEATAHAARWIWNEMKDNAEGAKQQGRALQLIVANLKALQKSYPSTEIHLVGHSAGSFVHGYLLELMAQANLKPASLTLYAPACSLPFAEHYFSQSPLVGRDKTWLHVLSDQREKDDTAGPYGKSLLYLVCRGFEPIRKTPLAGLEHCIDTNATKRDDDLWAELFWATVNRWRNWVNALPKQADGRSACEVVEHDHVFNGKKYIPASHGSFDNNKEVIERTINRILGNDPAASLAVPVEDLGE